MSHQGHIEGHIHVDCPDSVQATMYSACSCCNAFLDDVKNNIYELQKSARENGLCTGCGGEWCSGGCDEDF